MKYGVFCLLLFVLLLGSTDISGQPVTLNHQKGLKERKMVAMYLFEEVDINKFFTDCRNWGVNTVFSNSAYWQNTDFKNKAAEYCIDIGLLFPVFFNQEYLEAHPDEYCITSNGNKAIKNWLHFGCPTSDSFRLYQKNYLRKVLPILNPKIVALDFIRFYVHWESVPRSASFDEIEDGCYCERCLHHFEKYSRVRLGERSAAWIKKNVLERWTDWKCTIIENTVKEFAAIVKQYNPSIPVGAKIVPWTQQQYKSGLRSIAGQDIRRMKKYADFFMPMTYSHLLGHTTSWIDSLLIEANRITGKKVYATAEMEKAVAEEPEITLEEFKSMLVHGSGRPSSGLVVFYYRKGAGNAAFGEILSTFLKE
jgi:hypothetical protein